MDSPLKIINLNHQLTDLDNAKVSILDRGYLFGDAVYEAISFYNGALYLCPEHLDRLEKSLAAILLPNPMSKSQWIDTLTELIHYNNMKDQDGFIYLQISRTGDMTRHHVWQNNVPFFTAMVFSKPMPSSLVKIKVISLNDERWQRCDIKSTSLLANTMAAKKASSQKAAECLLFKDNWLTEGSSSNVFMIKDQNIYTPYTDNILKGITRDKIFDLANTMNLKCSQKNISYDEIIGADELFITSTTRIIQSVSALNDHTFPQESPMTEQLFQKFIHTIQNDHTTTGTH